MRVFPSPPFTFLTRHIISHLRHVLTDLLFLLSHEKVRFFPQGPPTAHPSSCSSSLSSPPVVGFLPFAVRAFVLACSRVWLYSHEGLRNDVQPSAYYTRTMSYLFPILTRLPLPFFLAVPPACVPPWVDQIRLTFAAKGKPLAALDNHASR